MHCITETQWCTGRPGCVARDQRSWCSSTSASPWRTCVCTARKCPSKPDTKLPLAVPPAACFDLSGRCSGGTAGPFQAKWNVYFNACTCNVWLIFLIRMARVTPGAPRTSVRLHVLVFQPNSVHAALISISVWHGTLRFAARLFDINRLHWLIGGLSRRCFSPDFWYGLKLHQPSSLMHRCDLKRRAATGMFLFACTRDEIAWILLFAEHI